MPRFCLPLQVPLCFPTAEAVEKTRRPVSAATKTTALESFIATEVFAASALSKSRSKTCARAVSSLYLNAVRRRVDLRSYNFPMDFQYDLDSWEEFELELEKLAAENQVLSESSAANSTALLFRGQESAEWRLDTTLERADTKITTIGEYFRFLGAAKPQLETLTGQRWTDLDVVAIRKTYENYDSFFYSPFPSYELCVYARHHGFPSPLLDWTRSPYIAAYFAFQAPQAERVAIWVYRESDGPGRVSFSDEPQIKNLGQFVAAHPRHFLQQGQYTLSAQYKNQVWHLASHHAVFDLNRTGQDVHIKFTLPEALRQKVLSRLDQFNINAYSLYQSVDAMAETIAARLQPRYS